MPITQLPISKSDLDNLRASGLTDATIRANQLRTKGDALVFPYRDLNGAVNCFARFRPHVPRKIDGREAKYVQPKGSSLAPISQLKACPSSATAPVRSS